MFALSAEADREALIVSVHDVAPATRAAAEKIVAELSHHRVPVCSLLVVPNYHHRGSSTEDRGFVRWLQDLEAQGHEIVIHGYFHERPRRNGENLREKFFTRSYTNDEGEFYDLDYDEAFRRITQARDEFAGRGIDAARFYRTRVAAWPGRGASGGGSGNGIHDPIDGGARLAFRR